MEQKPSLPFTITILWLIIFFAVNYGECFPANETNGEVADPSRGNGNVFYLPITIYIAVELRMEQMYGYYTTNELKKEDDLEKPSTTTKLLKPETPFRIAVAVCTYKPQRTIPDDELVLPSSFKEQFKEMNTNSVLAIKANFRFQKLYECVEYCSQHYPSCFREKTKFHVLIWEPQIVDYYDRLIWQAGEAVYQTYLLKERHNKPLDLLKSFKPFASLTKPKQSELEAVKTAPIPEAYYQRVYYEDIDSVRFQPNLDEERYVGDGFRDWFGGQGV